MSDPIPTPPPKGFEDAKVIPLAKPVQGPAGPVDPLVLREPTAGEMRDMRARAPVDREEAIVSTVAGIPPSVVEALLASELFAADAWLNAWADEAGLPDDSKLEELVIPLPKPVSAGEVRYTEIRLREPTAGQVRQIRGEDPVNQQIAAVAAVSGIPDAVVARIGIRAVTRAENYVVGFIEAGRRRGLGAGR